MNDKRKLLDLDDNDLLNLLESAPEADPEENYFSHDNQILYFIKQYGLRKGSERVHKLMLYKLFKLTYKNINLVSFTVEMCKYFDFAYKGSVINSFYIDTSAIQISELLQSELFKFQCKKNSSMTNLKNYAGFLKHYDLKRGTNWVGLDYLYDELWKPYVNKVLNQKYSTVSKKTFFIYLKNSFKMSQVKDKFFFSMNIQRRFNEKKESKTEE